MTFKIAGAQALKEAVAKAKPVLLEPVMAVEVTTPEEYMGEVIGDINARRGHLKPGKASGSPGAFGIGAPTDSGIIGFVVQQFDPWRSRRSPAECTPTT